MKCVGRVSHLNSRNLAIVSTNNKVPKNTKIYDSEKRIVGRVVNIFGPEIAVIKGKRLFSMPRRRDNDKGVVRS